MAELVAIRTKIRTKATKLCNDLREYRQGDPLTRDQDHLALKIHHCEQVLSELRDVQAKLDNIEQTDDSSHMQTLEDELFLSSRLLARLEKAEETRCKDDSRSPMLNMDLESSLSVELPTFHGDVMKWSEFWELYAISVHDNPKVADVQKFAILKSHLAGVALRAIQSIPVSADGYSEAVAVLKERFERKDVCRERLLKDLMNMSSVWSNDLNAMRSLIDHLTANVRALKSLGVTVESFSSFLLPLVKAKIPEDWRIEWARLETSDFSEFLKFLQKEIRIRELARGITEPYLRYAPLPTVPTVKNSLSARRMLHSGSPGSSFRRDVLRCNDCGQSQYGLAQGTVPRMVPVDARWGETHDSRARFKDHEVDLGNRAEDFKDEHVEYNSSRATQARQEDEETVGMVEKTAPQQPGPEIEDKSGADLVECECGGGVECEPDSGSLADINAWQNAPRHSNLDCAGRECMTTNQPTETKETHGTQVGPDDGRGRAPVRGDCVHGDGVTGKEEQSDADLGHSLTPERTINGRQMGGGTALIGRGDRSSGKEMRDMMTMRWSEKSDHISAQGSDDCQMGSGTASEMRENSSDHCFTLKDVPDGRQMDGGTASGRKREGGTDNREPVSQDETDGRWIGGRTASESESSAGDCLKSADSKGRCYRKPRSAIDDPVWVKVGRTSHDCWDPGGIPRDHCVTWAARLLAVKRYGPVEMWRCGCVSR